MNRSHTNSTKPYLFAIIIFLFVLLLAGLLTLYFISNRTILKSETESSVASVAQVTVTAIQTRLHSVLHNMEVSALAALQMNSPQELLEFVRQADTDNTFKNITWMQRDGSAQSVSGKRLNIPITPEHENVFSGRSAVFYVEDSPVTHMPSIVAAVPASIGGNRSGILMGSSPVTFLSSFLLIDTFNGQGFSHIVDSHGNLILTSENSNSEQTQSNFFDHMKKEGTVTRDYSLEKMQRNMENMLPGFLYYRFPGGKEKVLYYIPVEADDWYLFSILPVEATQERIFQQITNSAAFSFIIIVLFTTTAALFMKHNRKYRKELETALFVDPITGGISCMKFEQLARKRITEALPGTYTFLSLDICGFKLINDINGGGGGNATLMYTHSVLSTFLNDETIMCRVNADVFNVLMPTVSEAQIKKMLTEFSAALNKFNETRKNKYFLRIKAGLYMISDSGLSFMAIRDRSNIARKLAKEKQRATLFAYEFYNDAELLRQNTEREFENSMEQALRNREFKMYLQPKINIQTGKIAGAEALVRWENPSYGLLPPDKFIPVFERNGFITMIDLYIFEQACSFLRRQIDENAAVLHISVNLSRAHLFDPDFLQKFIVIRNKYDIPSQLLEFEITESMAFQQSAIIADVINKIHAAGFSCSIDDFGSGYSSLNALADIPADVLKLDKAFFRNDSQKENRNHRIIASVIALAKQLGMKVVAEGIETTSQAHFLQNVRCDIIQGYIYSRPLTVADFTLFSENWKQSPSIPAAYEIQES